MLRQEVNLYQDLSPPTTAMQWLSWKMLCVSNGFLLLASFIFYLGSLWYTYTLYESKKDLESGIKISQQQFIKLKNYYPPLFFTQDAAQLIKQLKQEINAQSTILHNMQHQTTFSQFLTLFAQIIVPNVWLTEIDILKDTQTITLFGKGKSMDNIKLFLNNILKDTMLSHYQLNVNNINTEAPLDEKVKDEKKPDLTFAVSIEKKSS